MTAVMNAEVGYPFGTLENRHVQAQVQPVDRLQLEGHVLTQNLGNAAC